MPISFNLLLERRRFISSGSGRAGLAWPPTKSSRPKKNAESIGKIIFEFAREFAEMGVPQPEFGPAHLPAGRPSFITAYYPPAFAPGKSTPFVQIWQRQPPPRTAPPSSQPNGRVVGCRLWLLPPSSAREERRRLGRFQGRRRFMGATTTQRTILVAAIHPPASPAIAQICRFYACRSMSRASRKRT